LISSESQQMFKEGDPALSLPSLMRLLIGRGFLMNFDVFGGTAGFSWWFGIIGESLMPVYAFEDGLSGLGQCRGLSGQPFSHSSSSSFEFFTPTFASPSRLAFATYETMEEKELSEVTCMGRSSRN